MGDGEETGRKRKNKGGGDDEGKEGEQTQEKYEWEDKRLGLE